MAIVVNDNTPEFLRQFLISQGVIEVKDTETGQTKVVPLPPRRRPVAEQDDGGIDDEYVGYQVASAASGSSPGLFSNLFSSDDTDPDFQAMLTDVANQGSPVPASVAKEWDGAPYIFTTGEYEDTPDFSAEGGRSGWVIGGEKSRDKPDNWVIGTGNSLLGPSYKGRYVDGALLDDTYVPNYDGFVEMRGQDFYDRMSQAAEPSNPLDQFTNFVSKTTNEISKGLFGDVNLLGQDRTGKSFTDRLGLGQALSNPFSSFKEVFTDPYISDSRKAAYGLGKGVQSVVGSLTGLGLPFGLFSKMAHAAGAHHPFDLSQDSNIFADPISGTMTWDSLSPGAGGFQQGVLNMDNAIADIANQNPNQFINTPMGYITAENLNDAIKSGYFSPDQISAGNLSDVGFVEGTPFSQESFVSGNVTNQEALNQFYSGMGGAILNEAADQLGPNAGYNETRDLANAIAEGIEYGPYDIGGGIDGTGGGEQSTIDGESYDAFDFY